MFEQDDGNALIVSTWLDDEYEGASISSFFRLGGFEDLYDAIWTNVGDRVRVQETRPLSKKKRWRILEVLERAR